MFASKQEAKQQVETSRISKKKTRVNHREMFTFSNGKTYVRAQKSGYN